MTLTDVLLKYFVGHLSLVICLLFFLVIRWGTWVLGRKTGVKCHSHPTLSRAHTANRTGHCGCRPWSPGRGGLVRFLHCRLSLFPSSLYSILFQKASPHATHSRGVRSSAPPPWGWNNSKNDLEFLCMGGCVLYLLIQLLIYISKDSWIFISHIQL